MLGMYGGHPNIFLDGRPCQGRVFSTVHFSILSLDDYHGSAWSWAHFIIHHHLVFSKKKKRKRCWSLKQIYPLINKCLKVSPKKKKKMLKEWVFKVNHMKHAFIKMRVHLEKKKKSLIHTLHDIRISISIWNKFIS